MTNSQQSPRIVIDPKSQVAGPAIGLLVTGILGGFLSLMTLFSLGLGLTLGRFWRYHYPERLDEFFEGAFGLGGSFVGLIIAGFIIFVALKMKDLELWGLAVVASILAMIPCISPCCIVGLPIGIWSLVVLMKPEVKSAFRT